MAGQWHKNVLGTHSTPERGTMVAFACTGMSESVVGRNSGMTSPQRQPPHDSSSLCVSRHCTQFGSVKEVPVPYRNASSVDSLCTSQRISLDLMIHALVLVLGTRARTVRVLGDRFSHDSPRTRPNRHANDMRTVQPHKLESRQVGPMPAGPCSDASISPSHPGERRPECDISVLYCTVSVGRHVRVLLVQYSCMSRKPDFGNSHIPCWNNQGRLSTV
jgi:hypothetical protein